MRAAPIFPLFLLGACSRLEETPLTKSDWTNGRQPCSENRLSFRDGRIAYYPKGSKPLVMFEIAAMKADVSDPSLTVVRVRPTRPVLDEARRQGAALPPDVEIMMLFRVVNDRLVLAQVAKGDGSNRHAASPEDSDNYDLLRCRS